MKKTHVLTLIGVSLLILICGCTIVKRGNEPVTEPTPDTNVTDPVTDPSTEPSSDDTDPITLPDTDPATDPITDPVTDPVTEPVTVPVTEPATQPPETKPIVPTSHKILPTPDPWYAKPTATPRQWEEDPTLCRVVKRAEGIENRVFNDFYKAGIPATVVYEKSDSIPYGQVISVDLEGSTDDSYYYVKIGSSVVLHVSIAQGNSDMSQYNKRVMYLTFDDGPQKNTPEILAILARYNIKATFFEVGFCVEARSKYSKQCIEEGHAIGCHSYSHEFKDIYASADALIGEVHQWEDLVEKKLGGVPSYRLFRFCGGSNSSYIKSAVCTEAKNALTSLGYYFYDWTCANNDAWPQGKPENQTVEEFFKSSLTTTVKSVKKSSKPAICLMHETNNDTLKHLEWSIEFMLDQGYTFRTLDLLENNWTFTS